MKIDFDAVLTDPDGAPMKAGPADDAPAIALGAIACNALFADFQDEKLEGVEKARRYDLGLKVRKGVVEIDADDVALVKKLIGKAYPIPVVGPAYKVIESAATKSKK